MSGKHILTGLAAFGLAAALSGGLAEAQTRDGPGVGRPAAQRSSGVAPARIESGGMRARMNGVPRGDLRMSPGARIEPRIRSGATDLRQRTFAPERTIYGARVSAPPLTVRRGTRYVDRRDYYYRRRDGSRWVPGLLTAPFLLPGYLLSGGYGYGYDYDDDPYGYDPAYDQQYVTVGSGYPGPVAIVGAPLGNYCATPQKTCLLYEPAEVGLGCSCRAPAGLPRFRGAVVP